MTYLSEDPTLLAGGLLLLAGGFLVALRVTQEGKYLIWAVIAAVLAVGVVAIEWLWVTDVERIEQVVYDLADAVAKSDAERVISYMTPDVSYDRGSLSLDGESTQAMIRSNLSHARFEFVRVTGLTAEAGEQSRRGSATFHVFARGTIDGSTAPMDFGTLNSSWSLGFEETAPGVWKVNRIHPMQVSEGALPVPGGGRGRRAQVSPPDDGARSQRKSTRGGGQRVDPQYFNRERGGDGPQE